MRGILKALPLGVLFPLMLLAASNKPDDVASNISTWATALGLHDLPPWVTHRATDHWIVVISICLAVVYSTWAYAAPLMIKVIPKLAKTGFLITWGSSVRNYLANLMNVAPTQVHAVPQIVAPNLTPPYYPTLSDRLEREFKGYDGSSSCTLHVDLDGRAHPYHLHVFDHAKSHSKTAAIIVEDDLEQFAIMLKIAAKFGFDKKTFIDSGRSFAPGRDYIPSSRRFMVFTRLYIYYVNRLSLEETLEVKNAFLEQGAEDVAFRDLIKMINNTQRYFS